MDDHHGSPTVAAERTSSTSKSMEGAIMVE